MKVALTNVAADARRAGSVTQVAVIASNLDLGAIPNFFGHPQQYVTFLARELDAPRDWGLLVAMPQGLGYVGPSPLASRPARPPRAGHRRRPRQLRRAGPGRGSGHRGHRVGRPAIR